MKCFFWILSLTAVILTGCLPGETDGFPKEKPPEMFFEIENETYETILGSYCWRNACVDKVGPPELLEGQNPIEVRGGETISFSMNHKRKPNEFHLLQIQDGKETEIPIQSSHFTAPHEEGIYYYSYGVWWMDKKEENVSHGDAFYAFVLEVTENVSRPGVTEKPVHPPNLPTLSLTVGEKKVSALRGTYEWHYLNEDGTTTGIQADAVTPAELVERQTKLTVRSMTDIRLNFDRNPEDYDIQIWNFDNEVIGEFDEIELFGQKGDFIIVVVAHWTEGTVSYSVPFHID